MEIPATPGATGANMPRFAGTISTPAMSYENMLTAEYEKRFGPIPSGLDFATVNKAFQGPFPFGGMASVGGDNILLTGIRTMQDGSVVYPPPTPVPPPPPPVPTAHTVYLAKVKKAGQEQRAAKAAAARAESERRNAAAWAAIDGLEFTLDGEGKFHDGGYGEWDLAAGGEGLMDRLINLGLAHLEDEPLGRVTITVKFHGKDKP